MYLTGRHAPDVMVKSGVVYALVTDRLGSVRMVVNVDTGVVAQRISYDAWGNASYEVGTWDVQPFGFAGGLYDPLTKLVHFGAREYDAVTGRWTRADPILFAGGDANLYGYVGNDPVNAIDPSGLVIPGSGRMVEERRERQRMWEDLFSTLFSGVGADWRAGNRGRAIGGALFGAALGVLGAFDMLMSDPSVQMACIGSPIAVNGGPGFLTGYTRHGLNQAVSREGVGVSAEAILDALQKPLSVVSQGGGRYLFSGENASVILNSNGKVITTWANGAGGIRVP